MLPVYILGNLHCLGMCGPLVMMLGAHRYRYWYFLGRLTSFTLAGGLAGLLGSFLRSTLEYYRLPAMMSLIFGGVIVVLGLSAIAGRAYPGQHWIAAKTSGLSKWMAQLSLANNRWPTFLFGVMTVLLPCGQTAMVFAACAMVGSTSVGLLNGFAFGLLTSPSLLLAMGAHRFLQSWKAHYNTIFGLLALLVGALALCRGLADLGYIQHVAKHIHHPFEAHLVLY